MFGVDWSNPETLWLNITNLALGIVTLLAVGVFVASIVWELTFHRKRVHEAEPGANLHILPVPGLGLTMADGGEPIEPKPKKPSRK